MSLDLDLATSEDKAHAEYSASGSERWLNCPRSHQLSKGAPEVPESEYAAEGTRAHACFEFLLKNRTKLDAALRMAAKTWPEEMIEHATTAARWVMEREAEDGPDAEVYSERKIDASPFTCSGQFGTLDATIAQPFGRLTIVDFKYGAGILVDPAGVDGRGHSQLVYYGLGVSHLYDHNFSHVDLVVIQPRAYHESGETIRTHTLTMDELLAWVPVFRQGVMETNSPHAKLNSGKWCRFCPATLVCPELKENAMKQAQIVFSDTNGVESVPEPRMIQLPSLGSILDAVPRLEAWIEGVKAHATRVLEQGGEIEGWKLVDKRSPRRWKDEEVAASGARKSFGEKAFTKPKLLSPAQLEKAAKGAKGLDTWIEANVTTESSGTTLVSASDKRPAVNPIQRAFTAVPAALPPAKKGKTKNE